MELQKVRPLAREAQEGGGQAPRQGHQPPGAEESKERAEGGTGNDRRPPRSGTHRCPPGPCRPARREYHGSDTRLRGSPAKRRCPGAGSRPARRCLLGGRGDPALPSPPHPNPRPVPPGQVQRRPGGRSAPRPAQSGRAPRDRAAERAAGEGSGARRGGTREPARLRFARAFPPPPPAPSTEMAAEGSLGAGVRRRPALRPRLTQPGPGFLSVSAAPGRSRSPPPVEPSAAAARLCHPRKAGSAGSGGR